MKPVLILAFIAVIVFGIAIAIHVRKGDLGVDINTTAAKSVNSKLDYAAMDAHSIRHFLPEYANEGCNEACSAKANAELCSKLCSCVYNKELNLSQSEEDFIEYQIAYIDSPKADARQRKIVSTLNEKYPQTVEYSKKLETNASFAAAQKQRVTNIMLECEKKAVK